MWRFSRHTQADVYKLATSLRLEQISRAMLTRNFKTSMKRIEGIWMFEVEINDILLIYYINIIYFNKPITS